MKTEITKRTKLLEINNNMCHNFYYGIWGRFYNEDETRYRKFKFVVFFDIFDIDEYFSYDDENDEWNENLVTQKMIKEYLEECIWAYVGMVTDYNNENQLRNFYDMCDDSISNYNRIAKYW